MPEKNYAAGSIQAEIKSKLSLLSALTTFLVITLVAIILVYIYEPVSGLLDFLPDISVTVVILIVLMLTAVVSYISRMLTRQVLGSINLYRERLDNIFGFTRQMREEIYLDRILDKTMDFAVHLTGSGAGCILLLDGGGELAFRVTKGEGLEGITGTTIPGGSGIAGWVAEHGTPLHVEDVSISRGFESSLDGLSDYRVRSALCVPLKTERGMLGVIELDNKRGGAYDDKDVELVAYLAEQAAISIEKAEFYENQKNYEIHITDMLIDFIDNSLPEEQHPERHGHSRRVAQYVGVLAKATGMAEEEQRKLHFAGLLHDVGFLRTISEGAQGEEMERLHPFWGYEMLNSINFYKDIAPYILHHHERFDGQGHPSGLAGPEIPLQSRIIAVAEAFDAAAGGDGTLDADVFQAACDDLRGRAGRELDPSLVDLFIENAGDMNS